MLRKWGMLALALLVTPVMVSAQITGKISGVVTDGESGDPLPGASVVVLGTTLGTITDVDGNYFIIGIPIATYDVQASFVGYGTSTVSSVEISAGYTRELNFTLSPGVELDEIIVEYERPLIQKDAIGVPQVVSAEDIQNLPVRGAANLAALQAGAVSTETSSNLYIRGGREQEVAYYVDGVRVIGAVAVPTQAVQEQEMLIGSIPARYGDAMSGIISITTKEGGSSNFFGSIEGITSEVLDSYGYNTVSATLGGPLVGRRASFFLSTEYDNRGSTARAGQFAQLSESDFDALQLNPQAWEIHDADGNVAYASIPAADLAALTGEDGTIDGDAAFEAIEAAMEAQGYSLDEWGLAGGTTPIFAPLTYTQEDWRFTDTYPNSGSEAFTVNGNVVVSPSDAIRLRVGGGYETSSGDNTSLLRSLYSSAGSMPYGQYERDTYRLAATLTHYISGSTFYQLQADFSNYEGVNHRAGYSNKVEDVLFYGDISHPGNAVAARYYSYDEDNNVFEQTYSDGSLPTGREIHSTWSPPGTPGQGFTKFHNQSIGLRASATTQVGLHQIDFGMVYGKATNRYFSGGSQSLAKFYNDGSVEQGAEEAVDNYDEFPFDVMDTRVFYYGFDYLGIDEVDNQDVEAFATKADEHDAFNIAPYQPIYYAGYVQDKIEFRDIVLQLGARLDVFDNNALVLRDPYSLFEIVRAGDLGLNNGAIGADYSVFFDESTGDVRGFRDLEGQFYDMDGNSVISREVTFGAATEVKTDANGNKLNRLTENVFKEYEPQVNFQPRIGVSFPVTDQALFYASYDVVTQRPSENVYDTIQQYQQATEQSKRNNNPNLKPERTTQYELGFRQRLGARAAIQLSGFYRQIENKIALRIFQNVTPGNYQSYQNVDFGTVKGIELEFDLRRTRGLALTANYTLSFAKGTGADAASTGQIVWRQETLPFYPNFLSFLDFDQRHTANVTLDYRLGEGEGPMIGGSHPLQNFGMNLVATVGSGLPYTRREDFTPLYTSFNGFLEGELNSSRLPSTTMLNLRVDRRFPLSGRTNLVVYLWVQNLLDVQNVQSVYNQTGLPGDDGYLVGPEGRDAVAAIAESQGALLADSFVDHYRTYASNPFQYGIPRQTRIGLRLDF